jgi:hypothetical protein
VPSSRRVLSVILLLALAAVSVPRPVRAAERTLTERVTVAMRERETSWRVAQPFKAISPIGDCSFLTAAQWKSGASILRIELTSYFSRDEAVLGEKGLLNVAAGAVFEVAGLGERAHRLVSDRSGWLTFQRGNVVTRVLVNSIGRGERARMNPTWCLDVLGRVARLVAEEFEGDAPVNECENHLFPIPRPVAATADEALRNAIASGCLGDVRRALADGADANGSDQHGRRVLALAVSTARREVVHALLAAGAKAREAGRGGSLISNAFNRPACYSYDNLSSVLANSLALVDDLIAAGASIDAADSDGRTPLFALAMYNSDDGSPVVLIKGLLDRGADPNVRDNHGTTALMMAALHLSPDVKAVTIAALIAGGAEVNARTPEGTTALTYAREYAAKYPESDMREVYRVLQAAGAVE